MHTNLKLKSRLLTQKRCELISLSSCSMEQWTNILHPRAMLLMSFYFTKPTALPYLQLEHVKQSFRRYVRIYCTYGLKKNSEELEEYVEKCMDDLTLVLGDDHRIINHKASVKLAETYKDEPHRWYIVYGNVIPAMRYGHADTLTKRHLSLRNSVATLASGSTTKQKTTRPEGRTEAPVEARETSEARCAPSQETQPPKKYKDDIDDDDLSNEDDSLLDVLCRRHVRFDDGSATVRPKPDEKLVTVEKIVDDDTVDISLPKVEVEEAVENPKYGPTIRFIWNKFATPVFAKQHVPKRAKVSASNQRLLL
ncbi:hypothetical protein R1sor_007392 [Riccia sorocarpa]|uniref:Uncharacterized protein n=1 Tax=Riccia sorocarpa TaxID=122646 RepID=A0ABD3HSI8_9MARC